MSSDTSWVSSVVDGLAMGGLYALLALGLVFVYRSTRVINFAQGEIAMLATYVASTLLQYVNPVLATVGALAFAFVLGASLHTLLLRHIDEGHELNAVIVTVGLLCIMNSVA